LPGKTRLRMNYYVSSGTLNPSHSFTQRPLGDSRSLILVPIKCLN